MINRDVMAVPQLAVSAEVLQPFMLLEEKIREKQKEVNAWFKAQWQKTPPPVYGSVDLRNAGFKLSPVDMNLFPAGFNNLNANFLLDAAEAARETIMSWVPKARSIALVPESYTRNLKYWENVYVLMEILKKAGFSVKVASLSENMVEPMTFTLENGQQFLVEPLVRMQDHIHLRDSVPDLILLNNDLSGGIPPILQNLQQPLLPPAELGWHQRRKSGHFEYYTVLSREFADILKIDPWFISPLFRSCGTIDFLHREGLECLIEHTKVLLADIQQQYDHYGVSYRPFVVVKADAGTQGIAVMTIRSIDELQMLNRKQRTAMAKSKGGTPVRRVIVQEGVYTSETFGLEAYVAEPVVYLWGKRVVGGFYRIHQQRAADENLNAPGMQFNSLPFAWNCSSCPEDSAVHSYQQHLYIYGVIAQLSMLAAAKEIEHIPATFPELTLNLGNKEK